ncbi:hypothetical protein DFH29DRAFT_1006902 [Suillus ampliporus]|nr:hypothetical protein DFH29DRAFT_1006902 [Suillus ampliporus]
MSALTRAYLDWDLANDSMDGRSFFARYQDISSSSGAPINVNAGSIAIKVMDIFCAEKLPLAILSTDSFIASALVRQGVVPCSPISPSTGITIQALDFYRIARQRNPHFSIQAYVKTLCDLQDDDNDPSLQLSTELPSTQFVGGDRYLSREYIEQFATDSPVDMMANDDEDNPCAGRWKNMRDDKTKKMWGVFDESGVFLAVCRHGFSLVIADMVQSGEQAKYPLAVVSKLLDTFGKDLGGGYDIGCRFKTTLDHSTIGHRARELNYTSLVGAFHGHAHRRLCQLDHLATYVQGIGLEDLEGCERTFSKSNALASAVRYASVFHCRQTIANYFQHNDDFEIYANMMTFLFNKYKQALNILRDGQKTLPKLMHELGVTNKGTFDVWLAEEHNYLLSLSQEPELETLQMEYWQKLVNLSASKKDLNAASAAWAVLTPSTVEFGARDMASTTRTETARRHAIENYDKDLKMVQDLEVKLSISRRWEPEDQEWKDAGRLVANRKFQRALDHLESLVVARIFELSKMNRAGTGYKLRKHIGKALQAQSAAIRTALERYNVAARALSPPLCIPYMGRGGRRPWATPTGRLTMDTYFKMRRARKEIERLNIEVMQVATYLHDESQYLLECEKQLKSLHPALAHQVGLHRKIRARFAGHHSHHLHEISVLEGFTGSITSGESIEQGLGARRRG